MSGQFKAVVFLGILVFVLFSWACFTGPRLNETARQVCGMVALFMALLTVIIAALIASK